ncbi:MAG: response regulator, partial [Phycisphaerae bacterium]
RASLSAEDMPHVKDCLLKPLKTSQLAASLGRLSDDGGDASAENEAARAAARRSHRQSVRLLIAEDNRVNQVLALRMLAKLGYRAEVAGNGAEAIRALAEVDYDVVLMDVQMPQLDGLEATQKIRRGEDGVRNPQVPIIAMTANAMTGDRDECLSVGMNDYVSKPIDSRRLAEALDRVLHAAPANTA